MLVTILLASLAATYAAAQAAQAAPGFQYVGCVEADPAQFTVNPGVAQTFSAVDCQKSCGDKAAYTALGNGCHCDNGSSASPPQFNAVDEGKCSTLCVQNDAGAGHCGGPSSNGKQIFNLYRKMAAAQTASASPSGIPLTALLTPLASSAGCEVSRPVQPPADTKAIIAVAAAASPASPAPTDAVSAVALAVAADPDCSESSLVAALTKAPAAAPDSMATQCTSAASPAQTAGAGCNGKCAGAATARTALPVITSSAPGATDPPVLISEGARQPSGRAVTFVGLATLVLVVGLS